MYFICVIYLILINIRHLLYEKPIMVKIEYFLNRKNWKSSYNMSRLLYKNGNIEEAIKYIIQAEKYGAPIDYSSSLLGYFYYKQNEIYKAEKELKRAVEEKIDTNLAAYYLAKIYNEKGQYIKSIKLLLAYMDKNDKNNDILYLLGNTYDKTTEYTKAIEIYTKLIDLNQNNAYFLYNRGLDYYNMGLEEKALNDFMASIKLDIPDPKSYIMIGIIYNDNNEVLLAKEYFKKGMDLDSSLIEFIPEDYI